MIRNFLKEESSTINLHALPLCENIFKPDIKFEQTKLESEYYFNQYFLDMFTKLELSISSIMHTDLSLMSTSGTSFLNFIAIITFVKERANVLVDPNVHKSIIHSLELVKANVTFMPTINDCVYKSVNFEQLNTVEQYDVVVLSNGTYEGIMYDMKRVMPLLAKCSKNIIIDEAWGFINNFLIDMVNCALTNFCEGTNLIVTHSIHKTMPVMRQVSLISFIGEESIKEKLVLNKYKFHTTSPNYNLICSLEAVIEAIESKQLKFNQYEQLIAKFKEDCSSLKNINIFKFSSNPYGYITPAKILLEITSLEVADVYKFLRKNKIYCSYVSDKHILMHLLIDKSEADYTCIIKVLKELDTFISKCEKYAVCRYPPGRIEYKIEEINDKF